MELTPRKRTPGSKGARAAGQKRKPRWQRILLGTTAGIVALLLIVAGVLTWSVIRAFPQTDGTITASGLKHDVTVQRDDHGIPTLTAQTDEDLFFAQGFVHAQDRFWEMDFRRHMTSARLSELFGESQVSTDIFLRTLGWRKTAEEEVAALPEEELSYYESYAAGVNAYLEERSGGGLGFEYSVLGLQNRGYAPEPWTPTDSVAWLKAMAWDLRSNIEDETARALLAPELSDEQVSDLYPAYNFDEYPVIMAEDPAGALSDGDIPAPTRPGASEPDDASNPDDSRDSDDARDSDDTSESTVNALTPLDGTADSEVLTASADVSDVTNIPNLSSLSDVLTHVDALIGDQGEGVGSNSWVVAGEHTDTGLPLLADDPHLGASLPSVWTQMQLRCEEVTDDCKFDVAGYSFSGLPGIVIGHNQDVAWGFTNLTTDVADLYIERVEDDGYWRDGEKVPFESREETITVAGGDEHVIEVLSTGNGPIISGLTSEFTSIADAPRVSGIDEEISRDPGAADDLPPGQFAVSLRWTALDPGSTAQAIFALNLAEDFSDFRGAATLFDVPAQSLIYADMEGNIGYQAPGRLPIRGEGDGWMPQPGWDSAYEWQGYIPFEEQPVVFNPESGYIVTANNAIVTDDYAHFLSRDWDYGQRAGRIAELLEEKIAEGPVTAEDMANLQMEERFPAAESLQNVFAGVSAPDDDVQEALDVLAEWDGQNAADSAGAAYANVLWNHVTAAMVDTVDAEIMRDDQARFVEFFDRQVADSESPWWGTSQEDLLQSAAEAAHTELVDLQGSDPDGWNWGELHALTLTHGSFGTSGIAPIEALFNRGPYETGGGSGVVNATGWNMDDGYATRTVPSMRMVIDVSDWDASTWQNLTGQSGHAFHEHYTDQAEGWAKGEQYSWGYSPDAVDAAAEDILVLESD